MKRNYKIMLSAVTASALTFTALAQAAPEQAPFATSDTVIQHLNEERAVLLASTAQASAVIGLKVENLQHVELGRVNNFALDLSSGRIVEVIVSGGGGRLTAVPPGALQPEVGFKSLHMDVSPEKFAGAPRFYAAKWAEETESNRVTAAYAYFGEQPFFVTGQAGDGYQTTNQNGTITALGTRTLAHVAERELARQTNDPNNTISILKPDGTTSRDYYSAQHAAIGAWSCWAMTNPNGNSSG